MGRQPDKETSRNEDGVEEEGRSGMELEEGILGLELNDAERG